MMANYVPNPTLASGGSVEVAETFGSNSPKHPVSALLVRVNLKLGLLRRCGESASPSCCSPGRSVWSRNRCQLSAESCTAITIQPSSVAPET